MNKKKLIIGISGSSGIIYGIRLLELLKLAAVETHLVMSKPAQLTRVYETNYDLDTIKALANHYHGSNDIAAPIASGSFKVDGMIIAPCSMKTVGELAHGITSNLLTRAADVTLKERRRLVLLPRESPLHLGHLENLTQIAKIGGIICPPVPAFYSNPHTIDDLINETLGRVLDLFDLDLNLVKRWTKPF